MKRPELVVLAVVAVISMVACGGSGGGGDVKPADGVVADALDSEAVEEVRKPAQRWNALKDTSLSGVKTVRGFGCRDGMLYIDIDGLQQSGLFRKKLGAEGGFSSLFGGEGLISVIPQGVLVATFEGQPKTSSVVLVAPRRTSAT